MLLLPLLAPLASLSTVTTTSLPLLLRSLAASQVEASVAVILVDESFVALDFFVASQRLAAPTARHKRAYPRV